MRYLYECKECKKEAVVSKPMSEYNSVEKCKDCGAEMKKSYKTPPMIRTVSEGFK